MGLPGTSDPRREDGLHAETAALREELARLRSENEQLRESERMHRLSAEISDRLVWSTDAEGKLLSISRIFGLDTGTADDGSMGDSWLQVVHPEDRERVESRWRDCLQTGDPLKVEHRAILAGGVPRLVLTQALAIREQENGRIIRWIASSMDVQDERETELARREVEARLRESEELYRYAVELSRQIVWKADTNGAMVYLSDRFQDVLGEETHAGHGEGWQEFLHPEDRDRVVGRLARSLVDGSRLSIEFRLRVADGTYRFFCCRAAPRRGEDGAILSWYGSVEDIDERKRAEIARREAEERYRLAAKATNDAIWDFDFATEIVSWGEAATEVLGWSDVSESTPRTWWESRIHPDDKLKVLETISGTLEKRQTRWSSTYRFMREDGSYSDLLDRGFIIWDESGNAVRAVGAIADMTERRRAELELKRMQADLIHVSRVSAMGTMASTLAHELNQPLTAISNYVRGARRMAQNGKTGPDLLEALKAAEASALRSGHVVRRLRELVSRGTVSMVIEHLPKLIEEAGELALMDGVLRGVRYRVELDPAAQWIRADRIQIQQVLINLVRNAGEAMKSSQVREVVVSTAVENDDLVRVSVADTGPGIPPEKVESLFSQFITSKSGGMGIGLPITRTIVEAHGGKIRAENREGGGAVFSFTLPRAER